MGPGAADLPIVSVVSNTSVTDGPLHYIVLFVKALPANSGGDTSSEVGAWHQVQYYGDDPKLAVQNNISVAVTVTAAGWQKLDAPAQLVDLNFTSFAPPGETNSPLTPTLLDGPTLQPGDSVPVPTS